MFDGFYSHGGGTAVGISISGVPTMTVENNTVWDISGGDGGSVMGIEDSRNDGHALDLLMTNSTGKIVNNVFYQTSPGQAYPTTPGTGAGILILDSNARAYNNAIIGHQTGILVTSSAQVTVDYNGLWDNEENYYGVSPGAHDVLAEPKFEDLQNRDFHLAAGSPYVDAGTGTDAPLVDFEGESRPRDGDDNGTAMVDIGVDEYWPVLTGSILECSPHIASPAGTVTYTIKLLNPSNIYDLQQVTLSDPVPSSTTYISGSLSATSGNPSYNEGVIAWSGDMPAGSSVTITFQVQIDAHRIGPYSIINEAKAKDGTSELPRMIQTYTLVDPRINFLPIVQLP